MKMNRIYAILFVLILISCGDRQQKSEFVRTVKVTAPKIQSERFSKSYSGIIKESKEIDLGFSTAGKIERIFVKEGDFVKAGKLIAKLESEDYALGVEALQIQYDQLAEEISRMKTLYEQKCISENDYEKAIAGFRQLGVQLQTSKNKLEYTYLKSPVDGYIKDLKYAESEMVNAGTPVFTIVADGPKYVEFDIPVSLYNKMDSIDAIYCKDNKGILYDLNIASVSPKADSNQMFKITANIMSGSDNSFIPGMNVDIVIQMSYSSDNLALVVPAQSVFEYKGNSYVWKVVDNATVHKEPVNVLGVSEDGLYMVTGILNTDDTIVSAGVNSLSDGDSIRVIDSVSDTNIGGLL